MLLSALLVTWLSRVTSPLVPPPDDSLMAPGVSHALAELRATRIRSVRYALTLDVTRPDTAVGRVTIRFNLKGPGDVILDFRGPLLRQALVNGVAQPLLTFNGQHVRIPGSLLRAGANRIDFEFSALIAAAGASIIRVRDPSDGATYLYTLLVPSDAEQLFPCFDQPDLKARVSLTLTTPPGWRAVANGGVTRADSSSRGTTYVFSESAPISTYLIAFAAGPWEALTTGNTSRPITLYVRKSRAHEVDADSIIHDADRAVSWLSRYFAYRYPFQKLDILLAPAFPFGGMEHPGAIFFSEERFIFREPPTLTQRLGRTATVYHEVAHQWFGDLVTMRWFDDLWLKEGFATYMAAKMQASLDSTAGAWKTFYLRNKPAAYAVDVSRGTTAIWQPLGNLDQAKSNYGAIVYNKAPGVLKQLNFLVGESAFQRGLQRFVRAHAFGNATWRDLLDAIASVWGKPLREWGDDYVTRAGMPVLEQRLETGDGRVTRLAIIQHPAQLAVSGARPWPIRTELVLASPDGAPTRLPLTITSDTTLVSAAAGLPAPAWVFANADDNAYAMVLLDSASVRWLEHSLGRVETAFDRAMLWGALWDQVREATLSPDRFIRLAVRELPHEADEQILTSELSHLTRAVTAYIDGATRDTLLPNVEQMLLAGASDPTRPYGVRRSQLAALIRVAASRAMVDTLDALLGRERLAGLTIGPSTRWSIVTRLVALAAPSAARRLADEARRDSSAEGARRAFVAGAATPRAAVKADYFARYFADSTLNEDWATVSLDAFNALESRSLTRPFLRPALDSLPWIQRNRRIFFVGFWINAFLGGQLDAEALGMVQRFVNERSDLPDDLRLKVLQAEDELARTVRIRRRFSNE